MLVDAMTAVVVRPSGVIGRSVRWITAVIAIVAARVIPIPRVSIAVSRVAVAAVTISGITEADAYASNAN
jgi:hypothetical protein